jgi:tetratricopeptide (TPR) repeat protein
LTDRKDLGFMKVVRWPSAVLGVLCIATAVRGQGIISVGIGGLGGPIGIGGGGYPYSGHHHIHGFYVSGFPAWGGYASVPISSVPISRLTLYYYSPPLMDAPALPPLTGRIRPLIEPVEDVNRPAPVARQPRVEAPMPPQGLLDGAQASVFRPIREADRRNALPLRAPPKPQLDEPLKKGKKQAVAMQVPPREPPLPTPPPVDRMTESARQIKLGKEAFALREYARAERRFQQALLAIPEDPLAPLLLAQAKYAQGKYREAVAVIEAGLRLHPDWPSTPFLPRDLYGLNRADWADQLKSLTNAVAKFPNDPFLAFLAAYQLWFDNQRWQAQALFLRARALAPDPQPSDRFLQAMPAVPILMW